jgi:hypothetical protein
MCYHNQLDNTLSCLLEAKVYMVRYAVCQGDEDISTRDGTTTPKSMVTNNPLPGLPYQHHGSFCGGGSQLVPTLNANPQLPFQKSASP